MLICTTRTQFLECEWASAMQKPQRLASPSAPNHAC